MDYCYKELALDARTVLLSGASRKVLTRPERKGIDIRLFTVAGRRDDEMQTVATFLSSKYNPNPKDQKDRNQVDKLLEDCKIISDRVRSQSDFNKVNNSNYYNKMCIESPKS
ncbi:MAG TPA: hypothetical protein VFX18_00205 [Candidatus Nitrosocosmicus sp.]|nr:hypothetical protein [Candidatus Nitrosocosmicus sp.]